MGILGLKKANCKNCYKCIRECPVKAIEFKEHQAQIIDDACLLCGRCVVVCPQGAKYVRDDTGIVKRMIKSGKKVVASVAPSFLASFDVEGIGALELALKELGFFAAEETAVGAYMAKTEYEKILREGRQSVLITSCCNSVVRLVQKYYPQALPYVAPVLSPMQASGRYIKEKYPDAEVVFLSPCISKKDEIEAYDIEGKIDCALTFEELAAWFEEEGIDVSRFHAPEDKKYRSRFFPETGGILKSMVERLDNYEYVAVDGIENCKQVLQDVCDGNLQGYCIEMSACEGSCINGPAVNRIPGGVVKARSKIERYAMERGSSGEDFDTPAPFSMEKTFPQQHLSSSLPGEKIIRDILARTGKTLPEHELNCGACGYSTCREKAIAVYQGKAELEMCLPFMKERAENLSGRILNSTPNAIIAVDDNLMIQQVNPAAAELFHLDDPLHMKGNYIGNLLDPAPFTKVMDEGENIIDEKAYLPMYGKYVEQSIIYDKEHNFVLALMRDITQQETDSEKTKALRMETIEVTDRVIQKQMRVVQEIASLLGETTAETKIALTKLKNTVLKEEE